MKTFPLFTKSAVPACAALAMLLGAGAARAQTADTAAASPGTRATERRDFFQTSLAVGLAMPTEMTPERVFPTKTGVGPVLRLESTIAPIRYLELGVYGSLSRHPIVDVDGWEHEPEGGVTLVSTGGAIKGRLYLSQNAVLRLGIDMGVNYVAHRLQSTNPEKDTSFSGVGLNVGPTIDFRGMVSDHFGLLAMLGFWSQPTGGAELPETVDGDRDVKFGFVPSVFTTVGVEMGL